MQTARGGNLERGSGLQLARHQLAASLSKAALNTPTRVEA